MAGVFRYFTGHADNQLDIGDFVTYKKTGRLGFPREPICSSYDPVLGVYFVGTREGHVHLLGGGNVHLIGTIPEGKAKRYPIRMHAVNGTGELMILANDFGVYKMKADGITVSFEFLDLTECDLKMTATCILQSAASSSARLLLGTSKGVVYAVDSKKMALERLISYIPSGETDGDNNENHVAVQDIAAHPNTKNVLILYDDHRIVVHDASINETISTMQTGDVKPTTINFGSNSTLLISFEDGTYQRLEQLHGSLSKSFQVWGPYPCDAIVKMTEAVVNSLAGPVLIFSRGMPTASYGDRHTITLKTVKSLLVLDFPSKVLDFHISKAPIHGRADQTKFDSVLIVLTEHEIVMVDIRDPQWRELPPHQYFPMDAHALTSSYFAANIAAEVWTKMTTISSQWWKNQGKSDTADPFFAHLSDKEEKTGSADQHKRQLLLTGHEDGTINLFTCGEKSSALLFTINVSDEFDISQERERTLSVGSNASTWNTECDEEPGSQAVSKDQDEWPPFRKVGLYDQYSDEPGVAVLKLYMDSNSGQIAVSTKCGVNFLFELQEHSQTLKPAPASINLVNDPNFELPQPTAEERYRDPNRLLPPRKNEKTYLPGYQPCSVKDTNNSFFLQLEPRTPCTTMALLSSKNMVALANEFGFAVYNYVKGERMLSESFISSEDLIHAVGENVRTLYKSMKKSVRNTFRRKSRSGKKDPAVAAGDEILLADEDAEDEANYRPVERQIEARGTIAPVKAKPHLVKYVCFLRTPISDGTDLTDTFWVGLNGGHIYSYAIEEKPRQGDDFRLDKEIRLSHTAPVIHIGSFMEISSKHAMHRLLIVTEEQMRLYSLPSMKRLKYKVKLTSTEGLHIRKAIVATVHSATKPMNRAPWIVILTNTGEVRVYSTQNAKTKTRFQVVHFQNHIAISNAVLTPFGDVLYLRGLQTEFQRATISSHSIKWKEPFADTHWPKSLNPTDRIESIPE